MYFKGLMFIFACKSPAPAFQVTTHTIEQPIFMVSLSDNLKQLGLHESY